jgi:hypothetical protein
VLERELLENLGVNVDEGVSVTLSCVSAQFLSGSLVVVRGLGLVGLDGVRRRWMGRTSLNHP